MKIKENIKLSKYTTIKIGGRARYFVVVESKDEVKKAIEFIKDRGVPYFVIGGGSNLLIDDRDLNIGIIKLNYNVLNITGTRVNVSSSFKLPKLVNILAKEGLSGLEELAEIPGEIGGATFMNAGSFGREIGELIEKVEVFDGKEFRILGKDDLVFSYRNTNIKRGWIITEVELNLVKGDKYRIWEKINEVKGKRRKSQPVGEKTFGSVFKNPSGYSAGYMIDRCGLKGLRIGDAKISEKHANFIINTNKASYEDVVLLMETAESKVYNKFGIKLLPEVVILKGENYG